VVARLLFLLLIGWGQICAFTTIDEEPSVFVTPKALEEPAADLNAAEGVGEPEDEMPAERLIYLTIEEVPKKIYVGQIFPVTIKITSLEKRRPYLVELQNGHNVTVVKTHENIPPRAINRLTYYFKAEGPSIQLPAFIVRCEDGDQHESIHLVLLARTTARAAGQSSARDAKGACTLCPGGAYCITGQSLRHISPSKNHLRSETPVRRPFRILPGR